MYIQPITNNSISMYGAKPPNKPGSWRRFIDKIEQKVVDIFPNATFNDTPKKVENIAKVADRISRPMENRLIMGATAIVTQPAIDRYNHKVDEETRIVSRNRTVAKIIAGTTVGAIVRGSSYKIVEKMTDINNVGKHSKSLIPKAYLEEFKNVPKKLGHYRSALATFVAILAMCVTNFAIDAPLTVYLTNKFNAKTKAKQAENLNGGAKEVENG